jgi:hypothetical protein
MQPPVFKTGSSSGRMTSVYRLRRKESNLRQDGSEPPARTSTGPTAVFAKPRQRELIKVRNLKHSVRESHPICELQRLTSRLRAGESALQESNPPRQLGRLVPLPIGQGHMLRSGKGGSRTLKAVKLVPVRAGCHRQLACPSVCLQAPVGGVEPPIIGLTGRRLTVWPHRIFFEPLTRSTDVHCLLPWETAQCC